METNTEKNCSPFAVLGFGFASPSSLLIDWQDPISNRIYCKEIKFKNKAQLSNLSKVANILKTRYPQYFNNESIENEQKNRIETQLVNALRRLSEPNGDNSGIENNIMNLDLNKVPDNVNKLAKRDMDVVFEANRLLPGDPGYIWDKRVDFKPSSETSEWDED